MYDTDCKLFSCCHKILISGSVLYPTVSEKSGIIRHFRQNQALSTLLFLAPENASLLFPTDIEHLSQFSFCLFVCLASSGEAVFLSDVDCFTPGTEVAAPASRCDSSSAHGPLSLEALLGPGGQTRATPSVGAGDVMAKAEIKTAGHRKLAGALVRVCTQMVPEKIKNTHAPRKSVLCGRRERGAEVVGGYNEGSVGAKALGEPGETL